MSAATSHEPCLNRVSTHGWAVSTHANMSFQYLRINRVQWRVVLAAPVAPGPEGGLVFVEVQVSLEAGAVLLVRSTWRVALLYAVV